MRTFIISLKKVRNFITQLRNWKYLLLDYVEDYDGQREKKRTVDTLSQFVKSQGHRISKLKGSMDTKTIYVFKYSDAAASMSTIHDKYDVVSTAKTPTQQRSYQFKALRRCLNI